MVSADQVLARPEGGSSTPASEEALAQYSSNVLKALYSTEISKQLGMDRQVCFAACQTSFFCFCWCFFMLLFVLLFVLMLVLVDGRVSCGFLLLLLMLLFVLMFVLMLVLVDGRVSFDFCCWCCE